MIIDVYRCNDGTYVWGESGKGIDPDCTPRTGSGQATVQAITTLDQRGVNLDDVRFGGRADRATLKRYDIRRVTGRSEGRPSRSNQIAARTPAIWAKIQSGEIHTNSEFTRAIKQLVRELK